MMDHDKPIDLGLAFVDGYYAQRRGMPRNAELYSSHETAKLRWRAGWDEAAGPLDERPTAEVVTLRTGR